MTIPNFSAIILAAGESSRMGRTKALLDGAGGTMLKRACQPYLALGTSPLVVTGYAASLVETHARTIGVPFIRNPAPSRGMDSSVRVGLRRIHRNVDLVFVQPVDCPGVEPHTLQELASTLLAFPDAVGAKPIFRGRGGHPLVLSRTAWSVMLSTRRKWNLRQLLHHFGPRILRVETNDAAVILDIDTPADAELWKTR